MAENKCTQVQLTTAKIKKVKKAIEKETVALELLYTFLISKFEPVCT